MSDRMKKMVAPLLVLAAALVVFSLFGRDTVMMSLEDETVRLSGPEDTSWSVPYGEIASMELRESVDFGEPVEGGAKSHIRYGLWHSDELGDYRLFASDRFGAYILLRTASGETAVFNYESGEATRSYFESFSAFLTEQGYDVEIVAAP